MTLAERQKAAALQIFDEICQPLGEADSDCIERYNIVYFAERFLAALPASEQKPVAYKYEMRCEGQLCNWAYNAIPLEHPFGKRGIEFGEENEITEIPLFAYPDLTTALDAYIAERTADLEKQRDGMAKDAERLDFLDKNRSMNMGWSCGIAPAGNISISSLIFGKLSVREAIDAALASAQEGGAK